MELLHSAVGDLGHVEIAFLIDVGSVHVEQPSRIIAQPAPRIQQLPLRVVPHYLGSRVIESPQVPVRPHAAVNR